MTQPDSVSARAHSIRGSLADLIEQLTAKMQAGDPIDEEAWLRRHPEDAEELRQLLPALRMLGDVSRSSDPPIAGAEGPPAGQLGDFRLLREVGRGGMGVVYEAEQISLGRRVALKVLPFAATLDPKQLQRFKNEAQAAAHLHHTNIVPVFGVGTERGVHFYAMQFIEGQTLADLIRELRPDSGPETTGPYVPPPTAAIPPSAETAPHAAAALSTERSPRGAAYFRTVANLGEQAAEALEHAHQLGVIHRDIKPANLLLDVRGNLWVADFGLAHCQSQAGLTMTGDLVGTLRYMSPEQALAKHGLIDHRADVYSLGATLYELLTLEPVFAGRDRQELLRQIAFEEPRLPRRLNKAIPAELETVVLKAMAKNPAERYASAKELADDLRRFLDDKPVLAKRSSLLQVAIKWGRRHRPVVWSLAAVMVIGIIASAILLWREKNWAEAENARAKEENKRLEEAKNAATIQRQLKERELDRAKKNARRAFETFDDFCLSLAEKRVLHDPLWLDENRAILQKAVQFCDNFIEENRTDPEAWQNVAKAHLRMGSLQAKLGQDVGAEKSFRQAMALFERLVHAGAPHTEDAWNDRALCHGQLALLLNYTGRHQEAEPVLRRSIDLLGKSMADVPKASCREILGECYDCLGVLLEHTDRFGEAEEAYRQSLVHWEVLARDSHVNPEHRRLLPLIIGGTGSLGIYTSRAPSPSSAFAQHRLARVHRCLGDLLGRKRQFPEALMHLRQELAIWKKLTAQFPDVPSSRHNLADVHNRLGGILAEVGRPEEARHCYRAAVDLLQELSAGSTGSAGFNLGQLLPGAVDRL